MLLFYKEIQLVFDPVFENKCQNPSSELQEENNSQEHRKIGLLHMSKADNLQFLKIH